MTLNPIKIALGIAAKIISIIIYILTFLAAYGGKISPNLWDVPSGLVLFFPYLCIITLVIGLLWLCCRKLFPAITAAIVIALVFPMVSKVIPIHFSKAPQDGKQTFTLLTYNTFEFQDLENDTITYSRALSFVIASNADFVCMQESYPLLINNFKKSHRSQLDSIKALYPYIISGKDDIIFLSKFPAKKKKLNSASLPFCLVCSVNIYGNTVDLVGVHLASYNLNEEEREVVTDIKGINSAKTSMAEFKHSIWHKLGAAFKKRATDAEELRNLLDSGQLSQNVIICGDFNDVPLSWTYRTIIGNDYRDAYSETGFGPMYSYNAHKFYFHIDQILYKGNIRALSVKKGKIKCSDHYPQIATFEI